MAYLSKKGLLLLIILSFFTVKPLLNPGFFPMHDDTQPSRVFEMANALRGGMFPVRWSENLGYGYGYPLFNFYAPLAYYSGSVFYFLGFDALNATKLMIGLVMLSSAVTMYYLAKTFWGESGGVLSGLLYTFAPYHALNLYVRGDTAELYAYVFIPLVFLALYKIWNLFQSGTIIKNKVTNIRLKYKNLWLWLGMGSLAYAAIITSHNLTALIVTPFILTVILILSLASVRRKLFRVSKYLISVFVLGVVVAAFYWLPALGEMRYTNVLSQIGGKADFRLHYVCISQIWDSPWGFGGSAPGCVDGMSFRLGKLHIILSLTVFVIFVVQRKKIKQLLPPILTIFLFLVLSIFLTSEYSRILWEFLPVMKFIQYPWRFLMLSTFFSSLLSGFLLQYIEIKLKGHQSPMYISFFCLVLFIALTLFFYLKLFTPLMTIAKTANDYTSATALKWEISKISDEYLPKYFSKPQDEKDIVNSKISILQGNAVINNIDVKSHYIKAEVGVVRQPALVSIKTAYFPGWNLYLNNKKHKYDITDKGLLTVLPKGRHSLLLLFEQTPLEKTANLLSIIGIFILILGIIRAYRFHPS